MEKFILTLIKWYFTVLSALFPRYAGQKALILFQKPQKAPLKKRDKHFYQTWNQFTIESEIGPIPCYDKGDPNGKTILLVHGWASNAGSMSGIGNSLVDIGYYVVTFDLPGHGKSSQKLANLYVTGTAVRSVFAKLKLRNDQPISIVSHSFGSATTAFGLSKSDLKVDHMIFLTTPNSIRKIFRDFQKMIGLSNDAYQEMMDHAYRIVHENVESILITQRASNVQYNKLTLIHDEFDKVLPYRNSELFNRFLPRTELITFEHVGHYRMLWNTQVIKAIMGVLNPESKEIIKKTEIHPYGDLEKPVTILSKEELAA